MIFAAIDIGSNAGRLLISSVHEVAGKTITEKISMVRVPLRLGIDVFEHGEILPERTEYLVKTFDAYKNLLNIFQPIDIIACGTAALREASNSSAIIERIKQEKGIDLRIIDGIQAGRIICEADNVNLDKIHEYSLYVDVGGGSTELSWFKGDQLLECKSFNIGTIKLLYEKVKREDWDELKNWIKSLELEGKELNCICSGGNINKLTKLYGNRAKLTLTYAQLADAHIFLEGYSVQDRIEKMGLRADRADVIVPAAIIFKKIMSWGKIHDLQAPKIGLADGLIIDLYNKHHGKRTILKY